MVCALGTGPEDIVEQETFATAEPEPTLERIVAFFERGSRPAAIGVGSFGPVDLDPRSATWGHVTSTPKPGWAAHAGGAGTPRPARRPGRVRHRRHRRRDRRAPLGRGRPGSTASATSPIGTGIGAGLLIERPPGPRPHPSGGGPPPHPPRPRARSVRGELSAPRGLLGGAGRGRGDRGALGCQPPRTARRPSRVGAGGRVRRPRAARHRARRLAAAGRRRRRRAGASRSADRGPGPAGRAQRRLSARRRCWAPRSTATWSLRRWATARACSGRSRWRRRPQPDPACPVRHGPISQKLIEVFRFGWG